MSSQMVIFPGDGRVVAEVPLATPEQVRLSFPFFCVCPFLVRV